MEIKGILSINYLIKVQKNAMVQRMIPMAQTEALTVMEYMVW